MLVLSRHVGQRIFLRNRNTGELIVVTQVDIRWDKSRIGLEASDDWVIAREELLISLRDRKLETVPAAVPAAG